MKIAFTKPGLPGTGVVVVGVSAGGKFTASAEQLDKKTGGMISRAVKGSRFKGDKGQNLAVVAPSGTRLESAILVGLGKPDEMTTDRAQALGGEIYALIGKSVGGNAAICVDKVSGMPLSAPEIAANVGYGARLRSYRFDKYRTKEKKEDKPSLKSLGVHVTGADRARKDFAVLDKIADGVFFTRDLVSEPANVLYPETLAKEAKTLERLGVKVDVLGVAQMKRLGMGSLLGVGQGSVHEPRLVAMRWDGAGRGRGRSSRADAPVAFVGKGVTFDSGGISIKPAANMEDMKWDMGGAGVVIGLMKALAGRKAKVNAVGVVGLVENLPSATAQRPGDVVKTMSGQTIEVINTDAEGRLVLADALHYCNDRFKPKLIVDLATLTGAIIISLGNEHAGLFSNDDRLAERLTEAGTAVGEKLWRMPLGEAYDKMIKSDIADMKNIGNRGAGSITAAQLLQRFVGKTPWAHLDIAGVTWSKSDSALVPKGGTAFGVRLLNEFVSRNYEKK
jgi:leucyl aminopeptidase